MNSKQAVRMTEWEREHYKHSINSSEETKKFFSRRVRDDYKMKKELGNDIFASLYKGSVSLVDLDDMAPSHSLNWSIIDNMMGSPEYRSLHVRTKRDKEASLLGSMMIADKVLSKIDVGTMSAYNNIKELEDELSKIEALEEAGETNPNKENIEKNLERAKSEIDLDSAQSGILTVVNDAAKEVREKVKDIDAAGSAFGLDSSEAESMNPEERFRLAKEIAEDYKLKDISDWLGRLKRIARASNSIEGEPEEVVTIKAGDNLTRTLPSEFAHLNGPTEGLFYQRYAESQLMEFEVKERSIESKGPFIIALDTSGSMRGPRENFSKALTLAFMEIGRKEKRDVWVIIFSSENESETYHLPAGRANTATALEVARKFYGGGTCFKNPLRSAYQIMKDEKRADLLFLSDGNGNLPPEEEMLVFDNFKKKTGTRVLGVVIGGEAKAMERFCDKVIHHSKLGNELAEDIYEWAVM